MKHLLVFLYRIQQEHQNKLSIEESLTGSKESKVKKAPEMAGSPVLSTVDSSKKPMMESSEIVASKINTQKELAKERKK